MIINSDTSIYNLYSYRIIDSYILDILKRNHCQIVSDIIEFFQKPNSALLSNNAHLNSLALFLKKIIGFQSDISNGIAATQALQNMSPSIDHILWGVYEETNNSFHSERIFNLIYGNHAVLFFSLISKPKILLTKAYFEKNTLSDSLIQNNFKEEKKRHDNALIYLVNTLFTKLQQSLGNEFFSRLVNYIITECGINETQLKKAKQYSEAIEKIVSDVVIHDTFDTITPTDFEGNNELQVVYEKLISNLSVRAQNVIGENLPNYTDILPWLKDRKKEFYFRKCGRKTIQELDWLVAEYSDYYNKFIESNKLSNNSNIDDKKETVQILSHLLEKELNNNSPENYSLKSFINSAYPQTEQLALDLLTDQRKIYYILKDINPKLTLDCIIYLIQCFSNIYFKTNADDNSITFSPLFSLAVKTLESIIEENRLSLEYDKYITEEKKQIIQEEFNRLVSESSGQCQNVINNNQLTYISILDYIDNNKSFLDLPHVGKKCSLELTTLLNTYYSKYIYYLKQEGEGIKNEYTSFLFPFLLEEEILFVNTFFDAEKHYPMFYLMNRYFQRTDNRSAQIFANYYGMTTDGNSQSIDTIAKTYDLSKERVRQIISKKTFKAENIFHTLIKQSYWSSYLFFSGDYYLLNQSIIDSIRNKEKTDYSFGAFCYIISLINSKSLLIISNHKKVIPATEYARITNEKEVLCSYVINSTYDSFNWAKALNEIARLLRLNRGKDIVISLNKDFIHNPGYWDQNNYHEILEFDCFDTFFRNIINTVFDLKIESNYLILKANKIDYKEVIYNILKHNKDKMHLDEIYKAVKNKYPDIKYQNPREIKQYILNDKRITSIGKSSYYQLTTWKGYTGSLRELALLLTNSHSTPVAISNLAKEMLKHRPDSTMRSTTSIISQCIMDGSLIQYYGNYVGIPGIEYDDSYNAIPQSFDEWINAFKAFTLKHNCFPRSNNKGFEGLLYHWFYTCRNYNNLESDEIIKYHNMITELQDIPHTSYEFNFLINCNRYRDFVTQTGRMISREDDQQLHYWFYINKGRYMNYNDNRCKYFKDLLYFLSETKTVEIDG